MLLLFWKFTRLRCRDLRVGVRCRRVRLSEVSKRPNYRSQLQNLVMLGWGDNNNDDAGLLRILMISLLLLDGFVILHCIL